jgi:carbamoyl-phosphate synthase large subunit
VFNFECDKVLISPKLSDTNYRPWIESIIKSENPDVIFPGRDDDVVFLSTLADSNTEFAKIIKLGAPGVAEVMRDKFKMYDWCKVHQLPVAESFNFNAGYSSVDLQKFIEMAGFPIIAKPKEGFGSNGVLFIRNKHELSKLPTNSSFLLQEYLGESPDLKPYSDLIDIGIPLFLQVPDKFQYAAQCIIKPDGSISEQLYSVSEMVMGRVERFTPIKEAAFEQLVAQFCRVLFDQGWVGVVNIQARPDKNGTWKVHEINLRFSGGTASRYLLGFDEIGNFLQIFYPDWNIPHHGKPIDYNSSIVRYLNEFKLDHAKIDSLKHHKQWQK